MKRRIVGSHFNSPATQAGQLFIFCAMAVYTEVSEAQVSTWLKALGLGELQSVSPIASGIENSNFFVDSSAGRWVLTVFERLNSAELPFYLELMQHLAKRDLPVPLPQALPDGSLVLQGLTAADGTAKPVAIVSRLKGSSIEFPDLHHVEQVGQVLARLHRAVEDFPRDQPNLRGLAWREEAARQVQPYLGPEEAVLLDEAMAFQRLLLTSPAASELPRGAVHADLFRDNALFDGLPGREKLSGVFDFYFAGVDHFAYDLAVVLNDWCIDLDSGKLEAQHAQALVAAYQSERRLTTAELRLLPGLRRTAALRFWLSRLCDWHLPRPASLLTPKPPLHFQRVLQDCTEQAWHPLD